MEAKIKQQQQQQQDERKDLRRRFVLNLNKDYVGTDVLKKIMSCLFKMCFR